MPSLGLLLVSTEINLALSTYCETAVIAELEFFFWIQHLPMLSIFNPVASGSTPITLDVLIYLASQLTINLPL